MADSRLREIRDGEETKLAESVSRAFFTDPMMQVIIPDDNKRIKAGNWMFAKMISYCRNQGKVYTDEQQTGGSVWLTPGNTTMTIRHMIKAGLWQMPCRLGLRGVARFGRIDDIAAKAHKKLVPGDHWYLLGLGVDPDSQKNGLGTEAIEIGRAQAHAAGLPVYLDTTSEGNVGYYEKRGFEVGAESSVGDDLRIWSMISNPK